MVNWGNYKSIPFTMHVNKNLIPVTRMDYDRLGEFNEIYRYCSENFMKVTPTPSKGMPTSRKVSFHSRYMVVMGNQSFEITIVSYFGCFRFLLEPKRAEGNTVSGQQACRSLYKVADNLHISLKPYLCNMDEGMRIKETIQAPHIKSFNRLFHGRVLNHVYHLDFNSSYGSRIAETYPELAPIFYDLYDLRHDKDGYYKHVMTNSIGAFQSKYCINYYDRHSVAPYQLAKLAKAAINGTRQKIEIMLNKLNRERMCPIMTNTDGIWYLSEYGPYHDDDEGNDLCEWKHDHVDCEFLMVSVGAYQFRENGKVTSVVRGICNLDAENPNRDEWEFGAIMKMNSVFKYTFIEGKGVKKVYETEEDD